ncbi:hypothetical protein Pelo_18745 [Pelomyxa schiedti]|nr:hypothetical protein Pelo_18745 [Pelomyxa schiedti]
MADTMQIALATVGVSTQESYPGLALKTPPVLLIHLALVMHIQQPLLVTERFFCSVAISSLVLLMTKATCIWERKTCEGMAPQPRAHHSAVLSNKLLYIFGGRSSSGTYFSDLHALDIEKTKWSQMHIPPLPSAHAMNSDRPTTETKSNKVLHPPSDVSPTSSITGIAYHTAVPCDNVMVVYGGLDGKFCFNGPFRLNLNKLVWERYQNSTEGENPIARHKHAAATIGRSGHCMILFGGFSVPPQLFDEIYLLNITLPEAKVSEVLPKEKGILPESSSLVLKQPQVVPPLESAPQRPLGQPSSIVPKTVPPAELPNPVPSGPKNVPSNTDPVQHGQVRLN